MPDSVPTIHFNLELRHDRAANNPSKQRTPRPRILMRQKRLETIPSDKVALWSSDELLTKRVDPRNHSVRSENDDDAAGRLDEIPERNLAPQLLPVQPLPAIAVAQELAEHGPETLGFAQTQMVRGTNRVAAALRDAARLVRSVTP